MSINNLKNEEQKEIILDNPNLKFEKILSMQNNFECEKISVEKFDFFHIDEIAYLAIPNYLCFTSDELFIFKINSYLNLEKIFSLEGHQSPILLVKNFYDKKNNQNYLITSDDMYLVIIWKVISEKLIIIKQTITSKYNSEIYSGIILFNNKNTLILTSCDTDVCSTEYDLDSGDFKRYIPGTKNNKTFHILSYGENHIIELCMDKIGFYNLSDEKDIYEINNSQTKGKNNQGCIIKDKLFITNNSNGTIIIIDLIQKVIHKIIDTKSGSNLFSLIEWNSKYLIATDIKNNSLNIIDVNQMKIINCIKVQINPKYIKKINLERKVYKRNNILLVLGDKMFFELWIKR